MSFTDGIKDLLKYKIVSSVNTGDKNLDNLYNAIFLSILAVVFTPGLQYRLYHLVTSMMSKCIKSKLNRSNYNKIRQYIMLNGDHFQRTTWNARDHETKDLLSNALSQYIVKQYHWIFESSGSLFRINSNGEKKIAARDNDFLWGVLSPMLKAEIPYPIYTSGRSIVALVSNKDGDVSFLHSDEKVLTEFIEQIVKAYEPPTEDEKEEEKEENTPKDIVSADGKRHILYMDRNFDKLVTKHKSHIINALNSFTESNKRGGQSKFNGLSTYNLGFLFYGPPGTGKTSFIKAISNYLRRDVINIDMRKMKTIADLNSEVSYWRTSCVVFVFDEFDCVQDLLQRKTKSSKEEAKEIQTEINKLLSVQATAVANTNTSGIDKQVVQLQEKIKALENQLNLENMLTWLDGTIEMRNRVIIAATNHVNTIDPALIREGRFDVKICLEEFESSEINEMLRLMYGPDHCSLIDSYKYKSGIFTPVKILNIAQQYDSIHEVIKQLSDGRIKTE